MNQLNILNKGNYLQLLTKYNNKQMKVIPLEKSIINY